MIIFLTKKTYSLLIIFIKFNSKHLRLLQGEVVQFKYIKKYN